MQPNKTNYIYIGLRWEFAIVSLFESYSNLNFEILESAVLNCSKREREREKTTICENETREWNKRISTKQSTNIEMLFYQYQIYWCVFYLCSSNFMCCCCCCWFFSSLFSHRIASHSEVFEFSFDLDCYRERHSFRFRFFSLLSIQLIPFSVYLVQKFFPKIFYQLHHRLHFAGDLCKCANIAISFKLWYRDSDLARQRIHEWISNHDDCQRCISILLWFKYFWLWLECRSPLWIPFRHMDTPIRIDKVKLKINCNIEKFNRIEKHLERIK